jgi:hypothetical protein
MANLCRFITLLSLAVLLTGCGGAHPWLRSPGPVEYQRHHAALHDPYPDNEAGPPIDGGRPLAFEKPLPEPVRSRGLMDSWWQRF